MHGKKEKSSEDKVKMMYKGMNPDERKQMYELIEEDEDKDEKESEPSKPKKGLMMRGKDDQFVV